MQRLRFEEEPSADGGLRLEAWEPEIRGRMSAPGENRCAFSYWLNLLDWYIKGNSAAGVLPPTLSA
jgi:hypothetical protein